MPLVPAAILEAAVQRSTAGRAEFTVSTDLSPGYECDGVLHGRIDFATDRCELGPDADRIVHTSSTTYWRQDDGRWVYQERPEGTWEPARPRGALEALRCACISVTTVGQNRFAIEFDRAIVAAKSHPGLSSDWEVVNGEVTFDDDGRIAEVTIRLEDPTELEGPTEPEHPIRFKFQFECYGGPVEIELPPSDATIISLHDDVEQLTSEWRTHRPPLRRSSRRELANDPGCGARTGATPSSGDRPRLELVAAGRVHVRSGLLVEAH